MRRRSTFIYDEALDFDPSEIKVEGQQLSFAGLKAAREEQLILGFRELPGELHHVLQNSQELHIRWASEAAYIRRAPYLSTISPGLHVSYSPLIHSQVDVLCATLRTVFSEDLKCTSVTESFSQPHVLSERFATTAALQYHSLLPSLGNLVTYIQRKICAPSDVHCIHSAALLNIVDYVDIDYDSISYSLQFSAYWSKPPAVLFDPVGEWTTYDHWNLLVDGLPDDRNEIGVLASSSTPDPHDLQLGGFLTTLGVDDRPKPTLFFFPSRHHALEKGQSRQQEFSATFDDQAGLHPTLRLTFPSASDLVEPKNKPSGSTCSLHTYLTLPSVLFADEYAFNGEDVLFQGAHNLLNLRSFAGEKDLEAPDYVVKKWGSSMLLELKTPGPAELTRRNTPWEVTIPLHLRYLEPVKGGQRQVDIPWPVVFWACTAEEGTKFSVNPFDRTNLGYDGLFGTRTMFYHLEPQAAVAKNGRLVETLIVPVLDSNNSSRSMVEHGTTAIILLGFFWVLLRLLPGLQRECLRLTGQHVKSDKKKQ